MKKTIFIFLLINTILNMTTSQDIVQKENNIVGKITIPNTYLNTYLMQYSDNNYYLNHSYDNKEDKQGSIFIDYRNDLSDKKIIIYGHNSKDLDVPFKVLTSYLKEDFYNNNKYIQLTLDNKIYTYEIFSVIIEDKNNSLHTKINYNDKDFLEHLKYLKEHSLYKSDIVLSKEDKIILLQTCNYSINDTYLLISAKRSVHENNL